MAIYRGVNGVSRKIIEQYRNVGGVNKKIVKSINGVNGVNRVAFEFKKYIEVYNPSKSLNTWGFKFNGRGQSTSYSYHEELKGTTDTLGMRLTRYTASTSATEASNTFYTNNWQAFKKKGIKKIRLVVKSAYPITSTKSNYHGVWLSILGSNGAWQQTSRQVESSVNILSSDVNKEVTLTFDISSLVSTDSLAFSIMLKFPIKTEVDFRLLRVYYEE